MPVTIVIARTNCVSRMEFATWKRDGALSLDAIDRHGFYRIEGRAGWWRDATPEHVADEIARNTSDTKAFGPAVSWRFALPGDLPPLDERGKEARRFDVARRLVYYDQPYMRQRRLAEIRAERDARLKASDGERARLEDVGTDAQRAALRAYRQNLRDLPATVRTQLENLTSPEAIDAYTPEWPA